MKNKSIVKDISITKKIKNKINDYMIIFMCLLILSTTINYAIEKTSQNNITNIKEAYATDVTMGQSAIEALAELILFIGKITGVMNEDLYNETINATGASGTLVESRFYEILSTIHNDIMLYEGRATNAKLIALDIYFKILAKNYDEAEDLYNSTYNYYISNTIDQLTFDDGMQEFYESIETEYKPISEVNNWTYNSQFCEWYEEHIGYDTTLEKFYFKTETWNGYTFMPHYTYVDDFNDLYNYAPYEYANTLSEMQNDYFKMRAELHAQNTENHNSVITSEIDYLINEFYFRLASDGKIVGDYLDTFAWQKDNILLIGIVLYSSSYPKLYMSSNGITSGTGTILYMWTYDIDTYLPSSVLYQYAYGSNYIKLNYYNSTSRWYVYDELASGSELYENPTMDILYNDNIIQYNYVQDTVTRPYTSLGISQSSNVITIEPSVLVGGEDVVIGSPLDIPIDEDEDTEGLYVFPDGIPSNNDALIDENNTPTTADDITDAQILRDILNAITDANENTSDIAESIAEEFSPDPRNNDFDDVNVQNVFSLLLLILILLLELFIKAGALLVALASIPASQGFLPDLVAEGLNFFKQIEIPYFEIQIMVLINWVVVLVMTIGVVGIVRKRIERNVKL